MRSGRLVDRRDQPVRTSCGKHENSETDDCQSALHLCDVATALERLDDYNERNLLLTFIVDELLNDHVWCSVGRMAQTVVSKHSIQKVVDDQIATCSGMYTVHEIVLSKGRDEGRPRPWFGPDA